MKKNAVCKKKQEARLKMKTIVTEANEASKNLRNEIPKMIAVFLLLPIHFTENGKEIFHLLPVRILENI